MFEDNYDPLYFILISWFISKFSLNKMDNSLVIIKKRKKDLCFEIICKL